MLLKETKSIELSSRGRKQGRVLALIQEGEGARIKET